MRLNEVVVIVGLSEFMFGYAFLYEQTHNNWGDLVAAPVLPNLQQEHELGWDAHLPTDGVDFYYQFKLSDYLYRHNAKFIKDGTYSTAYYRFALHKNQRNRQHRLLRQHSQLNPNTYYVAPEFNNVDVFNSAFLQRQITQRSRLIPLGDCDDIADKAQHYITYQFGSVDWIQHSEKREHNKSYTGEELPNLYRMTQNEWRPVNKQFAVGLFEKTSALVRRVFDTEHPTEGMPRLPLLDFDPITEERRDVFRRTAEILSVTLGVTLVIVGRPRPSTNQATE